MSRRRGRHDIVVEVLRTAKNGVNKTNIMLKCRLSYAQLERYLKALEKHNFIVEDSGVWETTKKGLNVVEACMVCQHLIEEIP